jgi:hypothetical protein
MNDWTEIDRREIDGYTIKICKTWEDMSVRDMYDEETEEYLADLETKIDNGEMEWFMLRVQATIRDYVLGETYCGGFLYDDAMEILTDGVIEDMAYDAIQNANAEKVYLKEALDLLV